MESIMNTPGNPFVKTMVKMKMPTDSGGCVHISGFTLTADKDGIIEIPEEFVKAIESHGWTRYKAPVRQ
jgi:hypothetical protein